MTENVVKNKNTVICEVVVFDPSGSSSLDYFNLLNKLSHDWIKSEEGQRKMSQNKKKKGHGGKGRV